VHLGDSKVFDLGERHPGLVERVDAMFDQFATIKAVEAMLESEYGEHIGHGTLGNYRKHIWQGRREREMAIRARQLAYQEWLSEGRN
jgi:hypothetical protein